ncbi:hypothetical protein [Erythrobacter sp. YT30]|uniref:hypothetical protein n=1 Tax=Erythrobacter sp. YT30 TaxID=1735012 RepID=UPI00076C6A7E|nr:hypothetical protein [Erythrobacter sp. YT30]KWV92030.1 hypothetical protein AUC45_12820 [Erythrobacter sp. YT30]
MEAPRLTLLPFLDSWDPDLTRLTLNVMTIPIGDPRQPLNSSVASVPAAPKFDGANIELAPHISTTLTTVPIADPDLATGQTLTLTAPAGQTQIYDDMAAQFQITKPQSAFERKSEFRLAKYLPHTYRSSFGFTAPKTDLAVIDDSYFCALRCRKKTPITEVPNDPEISWGEVYAMMMRHPEMARAAGLLHTVTIDLGGAFPGGWIFFNLASGSPFAAQAAADPEYLKIFGTRVPELATDKKRAVFTPVSFPIAADAAAQAALGPFDEVFDEAISFDDGFAKLVHARQPDTTDLAADDGGGQQLVTDPGIQLGWDDEDILIGMNRGISDNPDGSPAPEAPSGVLGYRVDVREEGGSAWTSLCRIEGAAGTVFSGVTLGALDGELNVEVHPAQVETQFWIPTYYTRWIGGSLVAPSEQTQKMSGEELFPDPDPYSGVAADDVPLRYGSSYEFRVRMADMAGGGPDWTAEPENPGDRPIASLDMRRKVRPRPPELGQLQPNTIVPASIQISRPRLGFPAALFTGHPQALSALDAILTANSTAAPANVQPLTIPDPDTPLLQIDVFVELPAFDRSGDREGFTRLSRTYRAFPDLTDLTAETPLSLDFIWVTTPRLSDRVWPDAALAVAETGPIELPTARNVRIEVRAIGNSDLTYWSTEEALIGNAAPLWESTIRVAAPENHTIIDAIDPAAALTSAYLQPEIIPNARTLSAPTQARSSPLAATRLATSLELLNDSGAIYAPPGRRVVFACNGLTHSTAPDQSSITFTSAAELTTTWINALRIPIDRDWSWIGLSPQGLEITRTLSVRNSGTSIDTKVASVPVPHSVNLQASSGEPDRERFEIILFDAFQPPMNNSGFPREVLVSYSVTAHREAGGSDPTVSIDTRLPIVTPPRVAPQIVSAGHALSPFTRDPDYAETGNRERRLWLEFADDPRKDPDDKIFGRVLALAPDPMLLPQYEPDPDAPSLAEIDLDPELIRLIRPGQAEDFAGLSAMQPLIPSVDSPLHFAVPLPPSIDSGDPELFGFFTMEFRVGHPKSTDTNPFWSTAQGRFGPPMVIEGIQFPAPQMEVAARLIKNTYQVIAHYAQPVRNGLRIPLTRPNTEIWFVLYARLMQADGKTMRNVQLLTKRASIRRTDENPGIRPMKGGVTWKVDEVRSALRALGLSSQTPLSTLGIELLPEPNGSFTDPLGGDLGEVRILRSSRLIEMPHDCCVL